MCRGVPVSVSPLRSFTMGRRATRHLSLSVWNWRRKTRASPGLSALGPSGDQSSRHRADAPRQSSLVVVSPKTPMDFGC
jgi:hypothetical protein